MDSIAQQLDSGDRNTKLDAYSTLVSLVKAYDEVPEIAVLKSKVSQVARCIRRDITPQDRSETDLLENSLTVQALKALVVLVWSRDFSPYLTDDFRSFILERSIQVLQDHKCPKSIIIHYVHLLATQDFRPPLLTLSGRVARIIDALHALTDHYPGNNITAQRLMVYTRLIDQVRGAMLIKCTDWLEDIMLAMVSSNKDVASRALSLGLILCSRFPTSATLSQATAQVLEKEMGNGRRVNHYMCKRLDRLSADKQSADLVPRIWMIVVSLVSAELSLEKWIFLKDWLRVIQRSLNSGDSATRTWANTAWNRFVSVARPHQLPETLSSVLLKPILAQLAPYRHSLASRSQAASSYCNLLRFAFRPTNTHKEHTRAWNEYIVKVMTGKFLKANADLACRLLTSLFWRATPSKKAGTEDRGHDNVPTTPEELPTIDCKWIRAHAGSIVRLFEAVLRYSAWSTEPASGEPLVIQAWTNFAKALSDSCCREIKPSADTKIAIRCVTNFLVDLELHADLNTLQAASASEVSIRLQAIFGVFLAELGVSTFLESASAMEAPLPALMCETLLDVVFLPFQDLHGPSSKIGTPSDYVMLEKLLQLVEGDVCPLVDGRGPSAQPLFSSPLSVVEAVLQKARDSPGNLVDTCLEKLRTPLHSAMRSVTDPSQKDLALFDAIRGFLSNQSAESVNQAREAFDVPATRLDDVPCEPGQLLRDIDDEAPEVMTSVSQLLVAEQDGFPALAPSASELAKPAMEDTNPIASSPHGVLTETSNAEEDGTSPARQTFSVRQDRPLNNEAQQDALRLQTPPRRPRHDNSQINFVEVNSSPAATGLLASQFLTERQKEIRDRQKDGPADVAFFSDWQFRNTEVASVTETTLLLRKSVSGQEGPATPELPLVAEDPDPVPSPTPKAAKNILRLEEVEVYSSPSCEERSSDSRGYRLSSPIRQSEILHTAEEDHSSLEVQQLEQKTCHPIPRGSREDPAGLVANETSEEHSVDVPSASPAIQANILGGKADVENAVGQTLDLPSQGNDAQENDPKHYVIDLPPLVDEEMLNNKIDSSPGSTRHVMSTRLDSEKIAAMSASQLSNDLDWHIAVESTTADQPAVSHKRPSTEPAGNTQSKRAKTMPTCDRRQEPNSPHRSAPAEAAADEIGDTIVVDVKPYAALVEARKRDRSSESQLSAMSGSQAAKKPRGRPRKSVTPSASQGRSSSTRRHSSQNGGPPGDANEGLDTTDLVPLQARSKRDSRAGSSSQTSEKTYSPFCEPGRISEVGITDSLRRVLEMLKAAGPEQVKLREVDDLCFAIRTEAQNAVHRQA